jgi:hypothetical protein
MARARWIADAIPHILRTIDEADDHTAVYELPELLAVAGGDREPDGYRSRSYWMAEQRGEEAHSGFRRAGLVLSFSPDARSQAVRAIAFRRDHLYPAT